MTNLLVKRLHEKAIMPTRAYDESAAFDLSAVCLTGSGHPITIIIPPSNVRLIGTGLAMRPPSGHLILICSRSGLASVGVFVANAPGVVDPDYTGEIKVALYNGSNVPHYVKHEDRIAQALLVPYLAPAIEVVTQLPETERGEKGFGSSDNRTTEYPKVVHS